MADIETYKELNEDEIIVMLDNNIQSSVGYLDGELSEERRRVLDYYNGKLPKAVKGKSRYVSMDVYDAVSSMSASLLETFASGHRIAKFVPTGPEDVDTAEICTNMVDYVCFRQNDLFDTMRQVIFDGLTARVGVARVYWEQMQEVDRENFDSITEQELDVILSQEDVELEDSETDEFGLVSGTILVSRDASKVCIEPVAPEEFLIEPQAKKLHPDFINFCAIRVEKTLTELRQMGYPEEKLANIGPHEDVDMDTEPEVLARHDLVGADRGFNSEGYQDQIRSVMCYEAYIHLDVEGTGEAVLHRVFKAGNVILDIEEVNRLPFLTFCPVPMAHAFYGSNFGEKLIDTQNARTTLTRSILDHAAITNAPRYLVSKGGLTNPRELIDNRVGGIVNVTRPDAIAPMPQAALNPFVFQTLKLLDDDAQDISGISRLSQGTNKDAVSKQNSFAMVERLANMSQQRQKIIARNFANQFLKPLFNEVYALIAEYEDAEKIIDVAGKFVAVDPVRFRERRDVTVELHLGYGEQDREAQKFLQLHQLFSQDPKLAPLYQGNNVYNLMKDALEKQGIRNVEDYLTPPDQLPPAQPDPAQMMQAQMAQKQIEIADRQTQVAEQKAALDAEIARNKIELDMLKVENDLALKSDNQDLREAQFEHKQQVDAAELDIKSRRKSN